MKNELVKLGGLWRSKSKNGVDYLSGSLSEQALETLCAARPGDKILIFRNDSRTERGPDYTMTLAPRRSDGPAPARPVTPDDPVTDDDIPF
ncbi:MAG TPA: hypothetical protein VFC10_18485 [Terriglobia bacterium]|jgi:hypothetical protein|nr:hypothetical protein [Terriglobia bacterium]